MYSRYPNYRFGGGIKIPDNYSGNAFSDNSENQLFEDRRTAEKSEPQSNDSIREESAEREKKSESEEITPVFSAQAEKSARKTLSPFNFKFDLARLFSGGFGFEEILLITLILLVSQSEAKDDLILFLIVLLFVG